MLKLTWFIFQDNKFTILSESELNITVIPEQYILRKIDLQPQMIVIELASEVDFGLDLKIMREALKQVPDDLLLLAIKAHSLIRWDKFHQFCGGCGHPTQHYPPLFERKCNRCQQSYFPRISPCVIVRIHKGKELLMTRSPHFAPGAYGLVAGYIEPGENAEHAVIREVFEETGIRIKNLNYFGSQPWPFPDALMLGFTAEYHSGELVIDKKELETAGWFDYKRLPGRPSNSKSLASLLIDDFIAQQT